MATKRKGTSAGKADHSRRRGDDHSPSGETELHPPINLSDGRPDSAAGRALFLPLDLEREQRIAKEEALKMGMEEKSKEFTEKGAEFYAKA
jgi:hypothetical protein